MNMISAKKIENSAKKEELIKFAQKNDCKAVYSTEFEGLGIECYTNEQEMLIRAKIKELMK